jgi:hypothetical protein
MKKSSLYRTCYQLVYVSILVIGPLPIIFSAALIMHRIGMTETIFVYMFAGGYILIILAFMILVEMRFLDICHWLSFVFRE